MSAVDSLVPVAGTIDFGSDVTDADASGCADLAVNVIAFDYKQERVLLGCSQGLVRVYDASTGALLLRFSGHVPPAGSSGDGAVFPTERSREGRRGIVGVTALGPDLVASVDSISVMILWRLSSGKCLYHVAGGIACVVKIDEASFVTGYRSGEVVIYSHGDDSIFKSRSTTAYSSDVDVRDFDAALDTLHIAVSGRRMVTAAHGHAHRAFHSAVILIWNVDTLDSPEKLNAPMHAIFGVHFSMSRIVAWGKGPICVWNAESHELLCKESVNCGVHGSKMVGENHLLNERNGRWHLVDLRSEQSTVLHVATAKNMSYCRAVAFSDDGRFAAWYGDIGMIHPAPAPIVGILRDRRLSHPSTSTVRRHDGPEDEPSAPNQPAEKSILPSEPATGSASATEAHACGGKRKGTVEVCPSSKRPRGSPEIPDFADLKERGKSAEYVALLDTNGIADLLAAHLVGYRTAHSEVFLACRKSLESSLLTAGVYGGEFIVGEEAVIFADRDANGVDGWIEAAVKGLDDDELSNAGTERRIRTLVKQW